MTALDEAVFYEARGAIRRLASHLDAVALGLDAIEASPDDASAHKRALELSLQVSEVRVFGTLLSVDDAVRRALEESVLDEPVQRSTLTRLRARVEASPRLQRALAAVHPLSFDAPGGALWRAWKKWLAALPDRQVWGLPPGYLVGLRALYVPSQYQLETRVAKHRGERSVSTLSDVRTDPRPALIERLTRAEHKARLLFVVGEPGVGKTALAQMLAAELATRDDVQPLLIRLRDVTPERPLFDEIARVLTEVEAHYGPEGPALAPFVTRAPRLVLVLDGFDELIQAGGARLDGFFLRLDAALREGRVASAVCFGRDTLFERDEATLPDEVEIFKLCAFTPEQVATWCANWRAATGADFDGSRFVEAQEGAWKEIARQPLLLMLLARIALDEPDFAPDEGGLAATYRKIITWCCERHEQERKDLRASELRRFLRVLGFASHAYGRAVIRLEDVQRTMVNLGVTADVERAESLAAQTILSFSMRHAESTHRAWEFFHRSLGEYLAAEFLAAELTTLVARDRDEFGETRWRVPDSDFVRRWIDRFGVAELNGRTLGFLRTMGADLGAFLADRAPETDAFAVFRERLDTILVPLDDESAMEDVLASARRWENRPTAIRLQAIQCAIVTATSQSNGLGNRLPLSALPADLTWSILQGRTDCVSFFQAIHFDRLPTSLVQANAQVGGRGDVHIAGFFGATIWHGCSWKGSNFWRTVLSYADMTDAVFESPYFQMCFLVKTQFDRTVFKTAQFMHCRLSSSSWESAQVDDAILTFCDLSMADLRGASFRNAHFFHCSFDEAQLEGACFLGATGLPTSITRRLDANGVVQPKAAKPRTTSLPSPAKKRR